MSLKAKNLLMGLALALYSALSYANKAEHPPAPRAVPPPPPGLVPIDEEIWVLVLVGLLYGLYKIYKQRSNHVTP